MAELAQNIINSATNNLELELGLISATSSTMKKIKDGSVQMVFVAGLDVVISFSTKC